MVMENLNYFRLHGGEARGLHLYCTLCSEHHKAMPTCLTEGGWQEISGLVINTVTAVCQTAHECWCHSVILWWVHAEPGSHVIIPI